MPAEFPLPPAQRTFINPAFRRNSLLSLSFGRSIDRDRFRSAWRTLLRVHPVLRTSFSPGTLVEHDFTGEDLPGWQEPDWSAQEPAGIPALWEELQERAAADFFKDGEFPLWRVYLIKLPEGQSHLLVAFHPGLIDRQSASTLLIQWLNASEAAEAVLDGLPVLPGLAMANASVDLGEPSGELWPEDWRGDCALEALRPWFWLRPADPSPGHDSPVVAGRPVPASLIDAIHARAAQTGLSAQNVLSLLWAGFWAARSEFGGAFVAHPFDLSEHLAPEHREILGRLCPLAPLIVCGAPPIDRAWPEEWWSTHMESITRSGAHIFAQPPANLDDVILGVGLPDSDPYPGSVAVWSGESINDLLHTRLPRWLGADARWTEHPALPVNLFMQGGRHPEVSLVAHPAHIDQSTCRSLCEEFLILAARALSVSDPGLPLPAAGGKTSTDGSLFSLSSDPGSF
jgi:hypothetical protein